MNYLKGSLEHYRAMAKEVKKEDRIKQDVSVVIGRIELAVKRGDNCAYCDFSHLKNGVREQLEEAGYTVEDLTGGEEVCISGWAG